MWSNLLQILVTFSVVSPNIPFRAQALISVHATTNTILPGLLMTLLFTVNIAGLKGGDGETEKIRYIEVTENIL